MIPHINIKDYTYNLPDERIAKYPLERRDSSSLLVYKDGEISKDIFYNLPSLLPCDSTMVFNDTKVVPARLHFHKHTGALIEVFCLKPSSPEDYNLNFAAKDSCCWQCIVGNSRKWKGDEPIEFCYPLGEERLAAIDLKAYLVRNDGRTCIVRFEWKGGLAFSAVLEQCGSVPIPPYLDRETEEIDYERYQTLYAKWRGSVAAPTAGLHFTPEVLEGIRDRGIDILNVCLHVGAGTFLPVKDEDVALHTMHREPFVVKRDFIEALIAGLDVKPLTAVGTTSVRTLESLYYLGVNIIETGKPEDIEQWVPYEREYNYSTREALRSIVGYMDSMQIDAVNAETRIIIVPGFKFRLVDYLVTNFHQPQSTLLLLIAAFVGEDWKKIYSFALAGGFRFLSYGDSSFLKRK